MILFIVLLYRHARFLPHHNDHMKAILLLVAHIKAILPLVAPFQRCFLPLPSAPRSHQSYIQVSFHIIKAILLLVAPCPHRLPSALRAQPAVRKRGPPQFTSAQSPRRSLPFIPAESSKMPIAYPGQIDAVAHPGAQGPSGHFRSLLPLK